MPVVLEFVDDPSPVVRAEALGAAEALLDPGRPDGRAVAPLTAALRNAHLSPAERAKIATLLGRTGAPRAAPVLSSLLAVHDPALRLAAIDALGMLGAGSLGDKPTGGAEDALLDQLSDEDPAVRLHAAVALGDAGGAHARDALLAKLGSGDELDRPAALTALGGVLSRTPSAPALRKVERTLDLAAGPERDARILDRRSRGRRGREAVPRRARAGPVQSRTVGHDQGAASLRAHGTRSDGDRDGLGPN